MGGRQKWKLLPSALCLRAPWRPAEFKHINKRRKRKGHFWVTLFFADDDTFLPWGFGVPLHARVGGGRFMTLMTLMTLFLDYPTPPPLLAHARACTFLSPLFFYNL